jgi:hypothetical protein
LGFFFQPFDPLEPEFKSVIADALFYALAAATPKKAVTPEMIDQAADLAGITILPEQKERPSFA